MSTQSSYLLQRVLLGGLFGILTGIVFGEYAQTFNPIGLIYIRLMEAAVYPYIISSLLVGLGRLTPTLSFKLFTHGWKSYALLLTLAFIALLTLSDAIPYASTITHSPFELDKLLALLIPSNLFQALSSNYVPAVILFCVLFGITLQRIDNKESLLTLLTVISDVCLKFWQYLVRLSPIAIFALLANTFGSLNYHQFEELYVYLILFFGGCLLLTFWILPGILSSIVPLTHKEILISVKKALLISLSTTLSAAAIPFLQRSVEQSLKKAKACHEDKKEIVDTCLIVGYPFAQMGNAFIYLFIFFSAFYYNHAISDKNPFLVALISYFSSIGTATSTINSLGFLSEWLALPPSTTNFYVSLLPILRYGLVLTSVMSLSFFTYITAFAYFGLTRVRYGRLLTHLSLGFVVLTMLAQLTKPLFPDPGKKFVERFDNFEISAPTTASMRTKPMKTLASHEQDALKTIEREHVIRIGFNKHSKPFSYFNKRGHLVGFDISYAHELAKSLHAKIEFIPFDWPNLIDNLNEGKFDLALGGIYVTNERLSQVHFTTPIIKSLPAIITTKQKERYFNSSRDINRKNLKIAAFNDSLFYGISHHFFPQKNLIMLKRFDKDYISKLEGHDVDGILWNAIQASLWANSSPKYISSTPEDFNNKLLFAFMIGRQSPKLLEYVNYWLKMKAEDGFYDENVAQWIRGNPTPKLKKDTLVQVVKKRLHLPS